MALSPQISGLAQFSTCELSDALVKLGLPHGGCIPDISMISSSDHSVKQTFCGPAYTVRMVSTRDTAAPRLSRHFIDTTPAGSFIVIEAPNYAKNAVWGGLMSAGALSRGAVGVIISGRCRDLAEHRQLGFPVFARGHSVLGQRPFTRPSEVNIPLHIMCQDQVATKDENFPSTKVEPGDWMIADIDGVVCVPRALELQTIQLATEGRATDALCMDAIKAGKCVQATFDLHRNKSVSS